MQRKLSGLVIFARYPRLGEVKTRLLPQLSPESALALYTAFLLDSVERTSSLEAARYLYLSGCVERERKAFVRANPVLRDWTVRLQQGPDLGARLWNAFQEVREVCREVVFMGADSPTLPLAYLREALELVRSGSVVIGPARDGGYYLIGLSEPRPELFSGLDWGTSRVLEQTLSRLAPGEGRMLPSWYDVDVAADLERLRDDLARSPGISRRTLACLQSLQGRG